jgi:ribosome biogenesis protein ENP2
MVVADDSDSDSNARVSRPLSSYEERAKQTFGQRAREASSGSSTKKTRVESDPSEIIRGAPGGGMEMSFIPSGKSENEQATDKKAARAKAKAKEDKAQFGAGLENRRNERDDEVLEGEAGEGRQKLRVPKRSASRTVVRQL